MLNLIKTSIFGLFLAKIVNFGLDPNIPDAKTDPFIPFGADLNSHEKETQVVW